MRLSAHDSVEIWTTKIKIAFLLLLENDEEAIEDNANDG
jgi:hypothetical protein